MKIASPFSQRQIEGFVKAAMDMGLNEDETEHLFRVQCNNTLISDPAVRRGFERGLREGLGEVKQASLLPLLSPEVISLALECQIKFGSTATAIWMRRQMGITPEDDQKIQQEGQKIASTLRTQEPRMAGLLNLFDAMPLNQKILLASLLGGAANGTYRAMRPTNQDMWADRGVFSRVARGATRGAATGAGAAAGMAAGSDVGTRFGADVRLPMMAAGGVVGGLAGRHLADGVVT